ncbi:hypothetical protein, partial [Pseudomonas putida]
GGFFLVGIHAPLAHGMPEHKISDTPQSKTTTTLNPPHAYAFPEQEIRAHALGPDANGSAVWSPSSAY